MGVFCLHWKLDTLIFEHDFESAHRAFQRTLIVKLVFRRQLSPGQSCVSQFFFQGCPSPDCVFFRATRSGGYKTPSEAMLLANLLSPCIENRPALLEVGLIGFRQPVLLKLGDAFLDCLSFTRSLREIRSASSDSSPQRSTIFFRRGCVRMYGRSNIQSFTITKVIVTTPRTVVAEILLCPDHLSAVSSGQILI